MPETWDSHGFRCVHCAISLVYDGVLTLTVKRANSNIHFNGYNSPGMQL
jgi:hypothetical protein